MLSASPEDGAALTPGPAAVLPLNPQLLQMLAPSRAPDHSPAAFNNTPSPIFASGPAMVPSNSPAVHTIFIASWVSILVAVGIIFLICAVVVASKAVRRPPRGPLGAANAGRRAETVEGAVVPSPSGEDGKPGTKGSPQLHRVIVQLPNDDICCGVELPPEDREGPKSTA